MCMRSFRRSGLNNAVVNPVLYCTVVGLLDRKRSDEQVQSCQREDTDTTKRQKRQIEEERKKGRKGTKANAAEDTV